MMVWVLAAVIVILLALVLFLLSPGVVAVEQVDEHDLLITLENGTQARGSSTVWHWYPSGKRCSGSWEHQFSEIATRHEWREVKR